MDTYLNKVLDDRYEIIEIIGTGGMAVVYKARDRKLNRLVAVKILKSELRSDTELRRRFHAESEAVARLNHPNIINVFDVSTGEDIDYFVMELIDGITLKQYINHRHVLSVKEALHFTVQILKGLEHAHAKKIVHRDIKPQNIMILRDGTAKVADFGIARIAGNQDLTVNQENAYGSVHYIAPEQARCEATDGRADIYSVGVMLYEMLTGVLPYEGDSAVAIAMQHIKSKPKPPREVNPDIPEGVEYIILKAMRSDPNMRYRTAGEMIDDIEAFRRDPAGFVPAEVRAESAENGDTIRFVAPKGAQDVRQDGKSGALPAAGGAAAKTAKKINLMPVFSALIVLMVLLALAAALWISIMSPEAGAEDVQVPSLVGRTFEEVLKDKSLDFELVKAAEEYSSKYDAGVIIRQDQPEGKTVKAGSTINLTVSLGKRSALMPNYINESYNDANKDLRALMEDTVTVQYVPEASDTITQGYVIRTDPIAGQTIVEGQTVTFYVSSGVGTEIVKMPNCMDTSLEIAKSMLSAAGLILNDQDIVYQVDDTREPGTVINQSVEANKKIPKGTQIILTVTRRSYTETVPPATEATTATPPATTKAGGGTKTTEYTLVLPQDPAYPDQYLVQIYQDGNSIYSNTVNKSDGSITVPVSGTGSVRIEVFIDQVLYKREQMNLS